MGTVTPATAEIMDAVLQWPQVSRHRPSHRLADSRRGEPAYPAHEHERSIAHFRGLMALWVRDEAGQLQG
jgi:hypothetical protein